MGKESKTTLRGRSAETGKFTKVTTCCYFAAQFMELIRLSIVGLRLLSNAR
jgi:hypothetical protein